MKKLLSYLKSAHSNFSNFKNFANKQKCLHLVPKKPYLRFSWLEAEKKYFHIWNQYTRICLIRKFCEKMKKYLFVGQKMPHLCILCSAILQGFCRISNQQPRICLIPKLCQKITNNSFWHKKWLICVLWR